MKHGFRVCLCILFILLHGPAAAQQAPEDLLRAVVNVRALVPASARTASILGTEREGNGVVIDANGHVLTIGYLTLEAERIEITGPDERKMNASLVGYDHSSGFGLLRTARPLNVTPMTLGRSAEIGSGDPVLVASFGGARATQGARVVIRREFAGSWEYLLEDAIFTVPPHAEFGGAALIDRDGRLVGLGSLLTPIEVPGLGAVPCNMFVPIDLLKPILSDLMATGRSKAQPRPWLGLSSEEAYGRVFVLRTTAGGPSDAAGLQPWDIILTVAKNPVTGLADFYRKVWALGRAGTAIPLTVLRGIQIREITVQSSDRDAFLQHRPVQ